MYGLGWSSAVDRVRLLVCQDCFDESHGHSARVFIAVPAIKPAAAARRSKPDMRLNVERSTRLLCHAVSNRTLLVVCGYPNDIVHGPSIERLTELRYALC